MAFANSSIELFASPNVVTTESGNSTRTRCYDSKRFKNPEQTRCNNVRDVRLGSNQRHCVSGLLDLMINTPHPAPPCLTKHDVFN
ncbi:hypothetical protein J6590_033565 [Homalodisca vitripennis]|nr:hypothetical protein J6590_033565 [Homalodisca vitripennis]